MTLTHSQARHFYDRFGRKQDSQGWYEDPALDDLVAHAQFSEVKTVFEFGCGTGRFAARILEEHLPASATYIGCDLSPTMTKLASERLAPYRDRVLVVQSDGTMHVPIRECSVDRVISTYVLDLLPEDDISAFLREAHRVLKDGGRLCLVSLTSGRTLTSKLVSMLWATVSRLRPTLVGGCRPIRLSQHLKDRSWVVEHSTVVVAYGVPSEVVVARSLSELRQQSAVSA